MSGELEVAVPFWLDRPDEEALDIALAARAAGLGTLWIGELASFDAFALATAVGLRAHGLRLKLGPHHEAGADAVGVVPSTAEDPAGRRALSALAAVFEPRTQELAS